MIRTLSLIALAASGFAIPAFAADYPDMDCCMKPSYDDWGAPQEDVSIEMGIRYWYSMGAHRMTVLGDNYTSDDTSHILEGHLRIDDHSTDWYAKGMIGYSAVINSTYSGPATPPTASQSGKVFYAGGDIGWMPVSTDNFGFGGFAGYQYWNNSPDMGRINYQAGSQPNDIRYNLVRLGITAKADFGMFDINAELAAIPYANLSGTYGALNPALAPGEIQTSPGTVSGWLYGAAGEVMARYHPTQNWTIGVGGRAWYLTGQADVNFSTTLGNFVAKTTNYSTFRYGLLGEITYKF